MIRPQSDVGPPPLEEPFASKTLPILALLAFAPLVHPVALRAAETPDEPASTNLAVDVEAALSNDVAVAQAATARLRDRGRPAFDELLALDPDRLGVDRERYDALVDQVGGARYCSVSKLYWHTELDDALAEAERTGKPVLALRMMGRLTDEFSCANSRFFRTTLYANEEIASFLRERYVLHWRTVRPVPKVTVDFGDGRKLERTLTGNSIHYVLTPDGHVVDGLPGLYAPRRFQAWLGSMHSIATSYHAADESTKSQYLVALQDGFHRRQVTDIVRAWKRDLDRLDAVDRPGDDDEFQPVGVAPPARDAAVIARPKALVELPLIADVTLETQRLEERTDDEWWSRLAALHAEEAALDPSSIALIRRENPAVAAGRLAITKRKVEDPLLRMLAKLQTSIAVDTVRNEYQLHRRLHQWFVDGEAPADLEELNEKVYAELFLTPSDDPWIGLVPADVYTGLVNGGVVEE